MSEDFQVGDVVVCVDASDFRGAGFVPTIRQGATYRVAAVNISPSGHTFLKLCGIVGRFPTRLGYLAVRFRKLPPADEAFTREMRALRPHRESIPA